MMLARILALLLLSTPAFADWPIFRGNPLQTGIATSSLPEKLDVLWKVQAKDGIESTAAIVDKIVYVGSFDGFLYALDLAEGKEFWKYKAGAGIKF